MRLALRLSFAVALVVLAGLPGAGSAATPHDEGNDFCLDEFYGKGGGKAEYSDDGKPVQISGELKVVMATARDGTVGCAWFLRGTEPGAAGEKHYRLVFDTDEPKETRSGTTVVATGNLTGTVLSVSSGSDPSTFRVTSTDLAAASGNVSVNVILVNFLDSVLAPSPAQIDAMVNTNPSSLAKYYAEASYGKLSISCTVRGPVTVNYNGLGNCNYGQWASAADAAAGVSGGYRMYVLAPSGCGWAGLATLGGSQSWINGSSWSWQDAYCHEFGHNLGMHHATAGGSEYADHSCVMGNPNAPPHANAPHKVELGWMASGTVATLTSGTQTYSLSALELSGSSTQIVRVPKSGGGYYYISYRAPIGLDAGNLESGYQFRTSVHDWSGSGGTKTALDSVLADGQSFSDAITGLTVTQSSHDAASALVTISLGPGNQAPVIQSGPTAVPNAVDLPGTATVSVTAADSDGPSALSYTWSTAAGPGTATFTPNGTTASDTSTVSFPSAGAYTLRVTVSDGAASVSGTLSVTVTDPNLVNAPTNLTAAASGRTITLRWTDASSNEDGFTIQRAPKSSGNSPGTFVTVAQLGANATTYTEGVASAGTYYYRVQAFTAAGRTSTWSNTAKLRIR